MPAGSGASAARARTWLWALGLVLAAAGLYTVTVRTLFSAAVPQQAYYDLLAEAFLRGELFLREPRSLHDLTLHEGRWYVPFPPMPALLLVPWVALGGAGSANTVWLGVLLGALSTGLAFLLLEALRARSLTPGSPRTHLALAVFLACGTPLWLVACSGEVWYVAQALAVAGTLAAACLAARGAPPWTCGAALALALGARPHVLLVWPLLPALAEGGAGTPAAERRRAALGWSLRAAWPVAVVLAALLAYNAARFGRPLEFGYALQNVAPELQADLARHGQFSLHYLGRNARVLLAGLPLWDAQRARLEPDPQGLSAFLVSPALLWLLVARARGPLARAAWTALGALLVPILLYYNTGWWQFGYRFVLDAAAPILVLLGLGRAGLGRGLRLAVAASVLMHVWGVAWWARTWYSPEEPARPRRGPRRPTPAAVPRTVPAPARPTPEDARSPR